MSGATPEKKLLDLIKEAKSKFRLTSELKIFSKINILLVGLIIIILAIFLVDVFTFDYKIPELNSDLPAIEPEKQGFIEPDKLENNNEFSLDDIKKDNAISEKDAAKDLSLLGIIKGEKDQAVVEDKFAKKTYFLYIGDSFGDFTLSDIKDSAVILSYKGERIELNM